MGRPRRKEGGAERARKGLECVRLGLRGSVVFLATLCLNTCQMRAPRRGVQDAPLCLNAGGLFVWWPGNSLASSPLAPRSCFPADLKTGRRNGSGHRQASRGFPLIGFGSFVMRPGQSWPETQAEGTP